MTWKPLAEAGNRQIRLVDSLSLCYFSTAAGDGCQHRHALTRAHPARITGPKRNTDTEGKPNTLSYCIREKKANERVQEA